MSYKTLEVTTLDMKLEKKSLFVGVNKSKILARFNLSLNHQIKLNDLILAQSEKEIFVSMPLVSTDEREFKLCFYPLDSELKKAIEKEAIKIYKGLTE